MKTQSYKAAVKLDGKMEIIETISESKKQFIADLRANGYKVNDMHVKKTDVFNHIMNNTNCNEWDWKENN